MSVSRISRISRYLLQKKNGIIFIKYPLRSPTIFVRAFLRIGAVRNYDETGKRFFLDFLRFGGGGGFCVRYPYFNTHACCLCNVGS
jgi:hypothetical protein